LTLPIRPRSQESRSRPSRGSSEGRGMKAEGRRTRGERTARQSSDDCLGGGRASPGGSAEHRCFSKKKNLLSMNLRCGMEKQCIRGKKKRVLLKSERCFLKNERWFLKRERFFLKNERCFLKRKRCRGKKHRCFAPPCGGYLDEAAGRVREKRCKRGWDGDGGGRGALLGSPRLEEAGGTPAPQMGRQGGTPAPQVGRHGGTPAPQRAASTAGGRGAGSRTGMRET